MENRRRRAFFMHSRMVTLSTVLFFVVCFSFSKLNGEPLPDTPGSMYSDGYLLSDYADVSPVPIITINLTEYYPVKAKENNIKEFKVTLLVYIEKDGTCSTAKVVSAPDVYGFNENALKVIKKIKFRPAYKDGVPVKTAHYMPIIFDNK